MHQVEAGADISYRGDRVSFRFYRNYDRIMDIQDGIDQINAPVFGIDPALFEQGVPANLTDTAARLRRNLAIGPATVMVADIAVSQLDTSVAIL